MGLGQGRLGSLAPGWELGLARAGSGKMLTSAHLCRRIRLVCKAGLGVGTAKEPGGSPGSQGMEDTAGAQRMRHMQPAASSSFS